MTEPTELPAALPRLPPQHLPRPRLHQPLLRGECRLRLLCAPSSRLRPARAVVPGHSSRPPIAACQADFFAYRLNWSDR